MNKSVFCINIVTCLKLSLGLCMTKSSLVLQVIKKTHKTYWATYIHRALGETDQTSLRHCWMTATTLQLTVKPLPESRARLSLATPSSERIPLHTGLLTSVVLRVYAFSYCPFTQKLTNGHCDTASQNSEKGLLGIYKHFAWTLFVPNYFCLCSVYIFDQELLITA